MSNIALPLSTIGDVVDWLNTMPSVGPDPDNTQVYPGRLPQGSQPPAVAVHGLAMGRYGIGLATEDWGKGFGRYQITCWGISPAQASALRNQALAVVWGRQWSIEDPLPAVFEDTTDNPTWWAAPFFLDEVDDGAARVPPGVSKVIWNDAGDFEIWNDAGDFTLWT